MKLKIAVLLMAALFMTACGEFVTRGEPAKILTMGDSLLAWNAYSKQNVSDLIERDLGEPVIDRSVVGARFLYGLPVTGAAGLKISEQYRSGDWDWVVLNGGGNDLVFGCGCFRCDSTISRMISADGKTGTIPELITLFRRMGARVIYVGYLHSPGTPSVVDNCREEDVEFEARIASFAARDSGVYYLQMSDAVPSGDKSYHDFDRVHPSVKGSTAIAERILAVLRQ